MTHFEKSLFCSRGNLLAKVTLLHRCFSSCLNCTNGTKSRKASHISKQAKNVNTGLQKGLFLKNEGTFRSLHLPTAF